MELSAVQTLVAQEAQAINRTLRSFNVRARVKPQNGIRICGNSFVTYTLEFNPGTSVKDVLSHLQDIEVAVTRNRNRKTKVRFSEPMYLEIDHPDQKALPYNAATLRLKHGMMLAGRDYSQSPAVDSVVDLDKSPHVLVAGISGSGKSTIVRSMVGTLALNTHPEDLAIYLVDLKNEDLLEFGNLPHTAALAVRGSQVAKVIGTVARITEHRVDKGKVINEPRVLLVVDEFAQLDKTQVELLDDVLSVGRSKRVYVIAATQKPTVAVMGSLGRANFTTRLVGRVADGKEAYLATGREKTGAELLPGRGAFLSITSDGVSRIQAYNFNDNATEQVVNAARQRWQGYGKAAIEPVVEPQSVPVYRYTGTEQPIFVPDWSKSESQSTGIPVQPVQNEGDDQLQEPVEVTLPLPEDRPLTANERAYLLGLYEKEGSKTKALNIAFKYGKTPKTLGIINGLLGEDQR